MEISNNVVPDNCQNALTLNTCDVHMFSNKTISFIAKGPCEVLVLAEQSETPSDSKVYYARVKTFCEVIKSTCCFGKIQYPNTTSYLYQNNENGISSLSFGKDDPSLENFDQLFASFSTVYDFNSEAIPLTLKESIKNHCPDNIETQDFSVDPKGKVKGVGKVLGKIFGKINGAVVQPSNNLGKAVSERADRFSRQSISEETKTKWQNIKEKSSNANEKMSNMIRPVVNGYYNLSDKLGEFFYGSENGLIKAVREYSVAFAKSLNDAEREARGKEPESEMKEQMTMNQLK